MNLAHNTWILDGIVDKNQALIDTIQQQVFLEKENSLIHQKVSSHVQFKLFDEKNHQSDDAQNKISSPAEWKYIVVHNNNIRWMEENI